MANKRLIGITVVTALILTVPLIAMQFTSEVNWTIFDFIVAGILLLTTGLVCDFVIQKVRKTQYRIAIFFAILLILLVVWAELAVGILGTPFAGT